MLIGRGNALLSGPTGPVAIPGFISDPYAALDFVGNPGDARGEIQLRSLSNAVWRLRQGLSDAQIGTWGTGPVVLSDYDFRMDTITGTLNSPLSQLADVWILGANLMRWGVEETGFGITSFTGTLRMRPAGGGGDIDTAACSMTAEST